MTILKDDAPRVQSDPESRWFTIYVHTCDADGGKKYVGQAMHALRDIELGYSDVAERAMMRRWQQHRYTGSLLARAILEFGEENFQHEVVAVVLGQTAANQTEAEWAKRLDCYEPLGYNRREAGTQGVLSSAERSEFVRRALAAKPPEARVASARKAITTQGKEALIRRAKKRAESLGTERLRAIKRKGEDTLGPDGRRAAALKRQENLGVEGRKAIRRKATETLGFAGRSAAIKKAKETLGPEGRKEAARKANETKGPEGRSTAVRKRAETLGPEGLSAAMRKANATMGPERRSEAKRKANAVRGVEGRRAIALKGIATQGPEGLRRRMRKAWILRWTRAVEAAESIGDREKADRLRARIKATLAWLDEQSS